MQKGKLKLDSNSSFIAAIEQEKERKEELFSGPLHSRHCWPLDREGKNNYLVTSASFLLAWHLSIRDSWYLCVCVSHSISFFWRIVPSPYLGPIWCRKEDSIPLIQQRECLPNNSFLWSKGRIEGWAYDVSRSISVNPQDFCRNSQERGVLCSLRSLAMRMM